MIMFTLRIIRENGENRPDVGIVTIAPQIIVSIAIKSSISSHSIVCYHFSFCRGA